MKKKIFVPKKVKKGLTTFLFPVLTIDEQKKFDMQKTLDELNGAFEGMG